MEVELPVDMVEVGVTTTVTAIIILPRVVMEAVRMPMEEEEEVAVDMGEEEIIMEEAEVDIIILAQDTVQGPAGMHQVVAEALEIEKIMVQIPE